MAVRIFFVLYIFLYDHPERRFEPFDEDGGETSGAPGVEREDNCHGPWIVTFKPVATTQAAIMFNFLNIVTSPIDRSYIRSLRSYWVRKSFYLFQLLSLVRIVKMCLFSRSSLHLLSVTPIGGTLRLETSHWENIVLSTVSVSYNWAYVISTSLSERHWQRQLI